MSNSDHWNSLASLLGAEVPAQGPAEEPKPVAKAPSPPPRPVAPATTKKPPPPPVSTDWSQLASQLGIASAEPRPAHEPSRSAPSDEAAGARRQPPAREAPAPPRHRREPIEIEEEDHVASDFGAEDFGEEPIEAELVEEDDEGAAAPTRPDDEGAGRKRRRRRRGGRRSKRDRVADQDEPARESLEELPESLEEHGLESLALEPGQEPGAPPALAGEEPQRKGRPKRRRRRGSGRSRDAQRAAADVSGPQDRQAPAAGLVDEDEGEPDELAMLSSGEVSADEDEGIDNQVDKNSHRAIPPWEEAIGYIVSVNMETRAKNPKSGPPRGRGRGRSGRGNSRGKKQRRD
jgi:hypothetical protein